MSFINAQNAKSLLTYTPSTYIDQAIKNFANKGVVAQKQAESKDASVDKDSDKKANEVVATRTVGESVIRGVRKGVSYSSGLTNPALLFAAASTGSFVLPLVGNVLSYAGAASAIGAHYLIPHADKAFDASFNRAEEKGRSGWLYLGIVAKLGAFVLTEIPRLAFTAANLAVAVGLGVTGGVLGALGHFLPSGKVSEAVTEAADETAAPAITAEAEKTAADEASAKKQDEKVKATLVPAAQKPSEPAAPVLSPAAKSPALGTPIVTETNIAEPVKTSEDVKVAPDKTISEVEMKPEAETKAAAKPESETKLEANIEGDLKTIAANATDLIESKTETEDKAAA